MEFGDLSDNPFAASTKPPRRRAFLSALKFLLLVMVCMAATVILGSKSQVWLATHLTADFDDLSDEQKLARLTQLAELGPAGIMPLAGAMADADERIARTAYELLQESQANWETLTPTQRRQRQTMLIDAVDAVATHLPDDRTGWGIQLVQQSVAALADQPADAVRQIRRRADRATDKLALSNRAGPSVLHNDPVDPQQPRRLTVRPSPIAVEEPASEGQWKTWPPDQETVPSLAAAVADDTEPTTAPSPVAVADPPSVYRSGTPLKLQSTSDGEPIALRDIAQSRETSYRDRPPEPPPLYSVTHLVDSPLETLDDQSVMRWLGSPHTAMREQAKVELQDRGFNRAQILIASQIASADTPARLALIDSIARADDLDPRPWLMMLLDDPNRQVKLRAISVLATMQDAYIVQHLRSQLTRETDAAVAARIRRVLELR